MKFKKSLVFILILAVIAVLISPIGVRPAHAQSYMITTGADDDGVVSGKCTFRDAIAAITTGFPQGAGNVCPAGNPGAANTIDITGQTINLGSTVGINGTMFIAGGAGTTVTITGGGTGVIDAASNGASPTFNVQVDTTFNGLTIQNTQDFGSISLNSGANVINVTKVHFINDVSSSGGGAISGSAGTSLTISGSTFVNDQATGTSDGGAINTASTLAFIDGSFFGNVGQGNTAAGNGGAIAVTGGTMNITGSAFLNNTANVDDTGGNFGGGAIYNNGATLNISGSDFGVPLGNPLGGLFANTAPKGQGGAIWTGPGDTTNIIDSAIVGNSSRDDGGAIFTMGTLDIRRTTIDQNTSTNGIQGIADKSLNPDVTISNVTVTNSSGNAFQGAIGTVSGLGPGAVLTLTNDTIFSNTNFGVIVGSGAVNVQNTIIANSGGNCSGTITSLGNNDTGAGCAYAPMPGDLTGVTAVQLNLSGLAPVGLNVAQLGYTPQTGSVAILGGNNAVCAAAPVSRADQGSILGLPLVRPAAGGANCTVGSIEVPPSPATIQKAFNPTTIASGGTSTITFTITNPNYADLTGAGFTDTLVNMASNSSQAAGGTCNGHLLNNFSPGQTVISFNNNLTIPGTNAGTNSCTVTVIVTSSTVGTNPNTAGGVTANGTSTGNPSAPANLVVLGPPTETKTFLQNPIGQGGISTLQIVITNPNTDPSATITGVAFLDFLPKTPANPGNMVVAPTPNSSTVGCGAPTFTPANGDNVLDFSNGTIAPNSTCTIKVDITAPTAGTYTNTTSTFTTTNGGTGSAAQGQLVVNPSADLSITKNDGSTTYTAGSPISYTITASNAGPSAVTGATVADTPPAAITGVTWTCVGAGGGTCAASGTNTINDATVNLPVGGSVTYTLSGTVAPATTGSLSNTATVATPAGTTDTNPANNTATDTDASAGSPTTDLSITKTDGSTTYTAGSPISYTITASNAGPSAVTGATVADTPPAAITGVTWTCVGAGGGTCAAAGTNTINDTNVNLPVGGSVTYTLTGTVAPATTGPLSNTATVAAPAGTTDTNLANNTATDTDTAAPKADLSITKTDGVTTYTPGSPISYTITASNAGPSAVTGATVADTPPAAITGVTWTCVGAGGGTCAASGTNTINDATVNLPVGGSVTYTLSGTVAPATTGSLSNTATVTAPVGTTDTNPANNTATDTDTAAPKADLSITKTDGSTTYTAGSPISYTITASNAGPSAVTGATVADTPPAAITGVTWTCVGAGGGTCAAAGTNTINDATVNLPVGGSVTYTLSGTVAPATTGSLSNTATVAAPAGTTDTNPANNTATDTDASAGSPTTDLSITKTDGVTTYTPGAAITYTITASNAGPNAVTGATVADTPPVAITGVTWTCVGAGGGTCAAAGTNTINDATVNLPVGGSVTYTLSGTVAPATTGSLSNTATVATPAGITDTNPGNNTATDTDSAAPKADLSITKTDGVTTYTAGSPITYTITASNAGPSAVTGATVTDAPPAAITGVTWTCVGAVGGTCAASGTNTINDTTVNLPVGGSVTYTLTGTVAPATTGSLSNTATVAAPAGTTDTNPANNSATDTDAAAGSPTADLSITKTDGTTTYTAGAAITYTITASNAGPSAVTGATVTDAPPAAITGVTWTCVGAGGGTCAASGTNTINDATVNLPVGGSVTYTLKGTVAPATTGNLSNTATVAAPVGTTDTNPANNSATDTDAPAGTPTADLSITKDDSVVAYVAGGTLTYKVIVHNAGPSNVTGATVVDPMPVQIASWSWTCVASVGSSCTPGPSTTSINDLVNILNGGTLTYTITANVSGAASGNLVNTATVAASAGVTDTNPANNSATDTDTFSALPLADLSITKTDGVTTYKAGGTLTYTVVVKNNGPTAVTGATVSDAKPAQVNTWTWTCVAAGGATCTAGPVSPAGTFTDTVNLPVGGTATYTVAVSLNTSATGNLVNTATVAAPGTVTDPVPGNNTATDTDTPPGTTGGGGNNGGNNGGGSSTTITVFDPAISKVGILQPGGFGFKGEKLTWEITAVNNGNAAGSNVVISDPVAPELHIDKTDTTKGSTSINGQNATFFIPTLNPGEKVTMHVYTTVVKSTSIINNQACMVAANFNMKCASAPEIDVPTKLPSTGYPPAPQQPSTGWIVPLVIGLAALLVGLLGVLVLRPALRRK